MRKNAWSAIMAASAVVLLAALVISVALGACSGMVECNGMETHMKCYWAYRALTVSLIGSVVMSVVAATRKEKEGRLVALVASILFVIAGVFLLSPAGIGTCGGAQMACNTHAVVIYVLSAVAVVLAVVAAFKADPDEADKPTMSL